MDSGHNKTVMIKRKEKTKKKQEEFNMGHCVNFDVFPIKQSKQSIFEEVDSIAENESDGGVGLGSRIRWYDNEIQNSYEEAKAFIEEHDKGWYDQLAVPFRQAQQEGLTTKKTIDLKRRISELDKAYCEKDKKIHYANVKSKTISCKTCESKISVAYLRSNACPVCQGELRPESVMNDLKNKQAKLDELRHKLKEEEKRLATKSVKNANLMWLVKTEFHV